VRQWRAERGDAYAASQEVTMSKGKQTDVEEYIEEKDEAAVAGKWGGAAKVLRKLSRELVEAKVLTRSWRKLTAARLKEIAAELVKPVVTPVKDGKVGEKGAEFDAER